MIAFNVQKCCKTFCTFYCYEASAMTNSVPKITSTAHKAHVVRVLSHSENLLI